MWIFVVETQRRWLVGSIFMALICSHFVDQITSFGWFILEYFLFDFIYLWIILSSSNSVELPWPLSRTTLLLNVSHPKGSPTCTNHRLIWCPYIGDADDSSAANTTNTTDSLSTCDFNKMLVLTHDNTVLNVCNHSILCSKYILHLLQHFLFWQYLVIASFKLSGIDWKGNWNLC